MSDTSTNLSANTASQWVSATDFANALVKARREALEEAAVVAERADIHTPMRRKIAAAIRALKGDK
jgi:hypothetical protein